MMNLALRYPFSEFKILSKIKNKTEINFKDLIIEIIFSEIARDTLKDIFPALSKDYNFEECCEEAGKYVAKRMLENESEIILELEDTESLKINYFIMDFFENVNV